MKIIFSILIFTFFLRLINIESNPPSLYGDELTLVYDAYSILQTGRDQTGVFLPLTFAMSEGRPPVYVYLSLPLVALFGPNALSARLLSVFAGVGIAFLVYLLLQSFVSRRAGLVGAFFVAISPWDLSLSRGGFETHLALFFSLLGIVTFIKARSKPWLLAISAVSFGLAIHTYHSYKVVLLLLLPALFWFVSHKNLVKRKEFILSSALFSLFVGVWLSQLFTGSDIRFKNTNIFNQPDIAASVTQKVNTERSINQIPFAPLFHNKFFEYSTLVGDNYLSHFSFDFLFLHGDGNPRHNQGLMGIMYVVDALLILLGAFYLANKQKKLLALFLVWIAVAPMATILVSPAHALRSTFMLPPLIMLSAIGFTSLLKNRLLLAVVIIGLGTQFAVLVNRVYFLYPQQFGHFWSVSAKNVSEQAVADSKKYDYVVLSDKIDSINLAFPVYAKVDPNQVISQYRQNIKKFGNIYIGDISNLPGEVKYYK